MDDLPMFASWERVDKLIGPDSSYRMAQRQFRPRVLWLYLKSEHPAADVTVPDCQAWLQRRQASSAI